MATICALNCSYDVQNDRACFMESAQPAVLSSDDVLDQHTVRGFQHYFQRFVIRKSRPNHEEYVSAEEEAHTGLLPDSLLLHIAQYLSARDLAACSCVSRRWRAVANDPLLWRQLLYRAVTTWSRVGHDCNPAALLASGQFDARTVYLRCAPEFEWFQKSRRDGRSFGRRLLDALLPRPYPRFALMGSGLDSHAGTLLVHSLMVADGVTSGLAVQAAFPGQLGLGAGFTYRLSACKDQLHHQQMRHLHLSVFYSGYCAEREAAIAARQPRHSRLFRRLETGLLELCQNVRDHCLTLNGLVYAVDITQDLSIAKEELYAAAQALWPAPRLALLVIAVSTSSSSDTAALDCSSVAAKLGLQQLQGAWRVARVNAAALDGLPEALHWLVDACHNSEIVE